MNRFNKSNYFFFLAIIVLITKINFCYSNDSDISTFCKNIIISLIENDSTICQNITPEYNDLVVFNEVYEKNVSDTDLVKFKENRNVLLIQYEKRWNEIRNQGIHYGINWEKIEILDTKYDDIEIVNSNDGKYSLKTSGFVMILVYENHKYILKAIDMFNCGNGWRLGGSILYLEEKK